MKRIVGFSGGIDSQACARWVLNRYPADDVILLNSNAGGNEHSITTAFVLHYSKTVHPVTMIQPLVKDMWKTPGWAEKVGRDGDAPLSFPLMAEIKGRFPSRKAQFCTYHLKIVPTLRWVRENLTDTDFARYAGVRRDESEARANTAMQEWDETFDCEVFHPLADWSKQMCFDYVRAHKEQYNELYTLGFERVGCSPCVNANKVDIRAWADRSPQSIDKVRAWEERVGGTFFAPIVPGLRINWVDEVVDWSRTDHGGRQFNILHNLERPSCESRFGLCE